MVDVWTTATNATTGLMMNERLRECVRQAGLDDPDFPIEDWDNVPLAKFANLIVQDCLRIVNRHEYSYHEADPLWETAQLIKEHFGVEE